MRITHPPHPGQPAPPPGPETRTELRNVPVGEVFHHKGEFRMRANQQHDKPNKGPIIVVGVNGDIDYIDEGVVVRRCNASMEITWA